MRANPSAESLVCPFSLLPFENNVIWEEKRERQEGKGRREKTVTRKKKNINPLRKRGRSEKKKLLFATLQSYDSARFKPRFARLREGVSASARVCRGEL